MSDKLAKKILDDIIDELITVDKMISQIENIKKYTDYTVTYTRLPGGSILPERIVTFWCGLVWPNYPIHPGYFCIFSEKWRESGKRGTLTFLAEGKSDGMLITPMLDKMTDMLSFLKCEHVYADLEDEQFYNEFKDYTKSNDLKITLRNAPFVDNFNLGVNTIERIKKKSGLEWGMPVVGEDAIQLQMEHESMGIQDVNTLKNKDTQAKIYPIHALRYIATGFEKYKTGKVSSGVRMAMDKYKGLKR